MQKISVAIAGFGNLGKAAKRAIEENADMVLTGVYVPNFNFSEDEWDMLSNTKVVKDLKKLPKTEVIVLCLPARLLPERVPEFQSMGLCTVDAFDEQSKLIAYKKNIDLKAKANQVVSMIAAGWEPGTNSAIRAIMRTIGITNRLTTTYGNPKTGGRALSPAAFIKSLSGVKNALALSFSTGPNSYKRKVYIELQDGADLEKIKEAIFADSYFSCEAPTEILVVKDVNKYYTAKHSSFIECSSMFVKQQYFIEGENAEFTANIMVSCARAVALNYRRKMYGAYTFIELPLVDYLKGDTVYDKLDNYIV